MHARIGARRIELALVVLLWITYAYFYQSAQHNEAARFDQIRALVEHGTFTIDTFAYNTADVVVYERAGERHVYPAKAPGLTFAGVAPFWLSSMALRPFALTERWHWHLVAYLTTILTVGLASVIGAVATYRLLLRMTGDVRSAALAVIAVWLGSISFPFSTLFFSHQQVAAQLTVAFGILFALRSRRRDEPFQRTSLWVLLAGALIGFSITSEYPTALLGVLLSAYSGLTIVQLDTSARRKMAVAAAFASGVCLGLLPVALYNLLAFGRLVYTPYQELGAGGGHEMFRSHAAGIVGVSWPGLSRFSEVLSEITVKPQRGLLYIGHEGAGIYACSPVLWLAVPGILWLAARPRLRVEAMLCASAIAIYFAFNASYGDSIVFWGGGASVGPRHIIPVLPFVAVPLCFAVRRLRWLFFPLLVLSVFYMLLATAIEPRTPYRPVNPWSGLYLPGYAEGEFAQARDGLFQPGHLLTSNSTAFNLAKLAGLPPDWQLAPLMVVWFVAGMWLFHLLRIRDRSASASSPHISWVETMVLAAFTALVACGPVLLAP